MDQILYSCTAAHVHAEPCAIPRLLRRLGGSGWCGGRNILTVPALSYSRQTLIIMMRLRCGMLAMAPCSCSCAMCMHLAHMMLSVGNPFIETPASVYYYDDSVKSISVLEQIAGGPCLTWLVNFEVGQQVHARRIRRRTHFTDGRITACSLQNVN